MPRRRPEARPVPGRYEIDTGTVDLAPQPGPPEHWLLSVNGVPSSTACPADPAWLGFEYLQVMASAVEVLSPRPDPRVVHLGAASCSLACALHARLPRSRHLAVELDAALARLVREWFDLPRSPALRLRVGEAGAELRTMADASADVVVRDVFAGASTPTALRTREFAADAHRVLAPQGLYLANVADRPPLRELRDEVATAATVFREVAVVAETAVLRGRRYGNAVLVAADHPLDLARLHRAVLSTGLALRVSAGADLR